MDLRSSSVRYELTDLPLLEAAIRSSTYLQYLSFGVDLSQDGSAEFRNLVASELLERIDAEAESAETFRGLGFDGEEFPINVMRWGSIYFVDAGELDRIGFYLAHEDARTEALHIAECFPLADGDDFDQSLPSTPRSRTAIRAWYTHDMFAALGHLDKPVGDLVIHVDDEALRRIRSGEEVYLVRPWLGFDSDQDVQAKWRFNMRGPGSASIWISNGPDEEPEIFEVTSMQFGDDPTIYAVPPIFEH